jgi:hypothetical protein
MKKKTRPIGFLRRLLNRLNTSNPKKKKTTDQCEIDKPIPTLSARIWR